MASSRPIRTYVDSFESLNFKCFNEPTYVPIGAGLVELRGTEERPPVPTHLVVRGEFFTVWPVCGLVRMPHEP